MKSASSLVLPILLIAPALSPTAQGAVAEVRAQAAQWRADRRTIDMHMHIDFTTQRLARAVKIMDAAGLGLGVNLISGTVTKTNETALSDFERNKALSDRVAPGRFLLYFNL